jgi:ketosteroid isomerase-like protein
MAQRIPRSLALTATICLLVVSLSGCSELPKASGPEEAGVVAALALQAEAWDSAIVRKDFAAIAGNMTLDFRQVRRDGSMVNREVFLRDITSPDLVIDPYTVEDFDARLYGDVALLCGRTRMTGRFQGEAFTSHYRYIDTYVRRDGKWKVCNVQITSIPEAGK